ncbi:hypothetical protein AYL99_04230 [Fonsecaea erecta]|uniref:Acyl-CoA dehydrogenase n=1 Tax=Fonsecaea erecta TaxID=1367422 RepID=A0A178ZQG1_9EURO|nr:hypothetical protein AYL99_04230 [Fonsecaea erecta]OAP62027.1 hypothetical protein AYL99_04230 [Fonsecaea erecta]
MSQPRETEAIAPWSEPAWWTARASPYYNESHRRLRQFVRNYIETHVSPNALEWEEKGEAPREEQLRWVASGIPFHEIPYEYRPSTVPDPAGIRLEDLDVFHDMIIRDETSRIEGGGMSSLTSGSVIGFPPVLAHGTEEQKRKWLPGLFSFETSFCLGITEPTGGSDVGNIQTTAVKTEDGKFYVVNGYKKWITGAPWATHMTTAVRTGPPGSGIGGVSVLVIPMSSPGLTIRRIANSGMKAGGASFVTLDEVKVPAENLIGTEGNGFKIIMHNFNHERFIMAIGCNRHARTCLSEAFDYAHTRHTFGKPLISHQIIRHKIVTLARHIESHWAWLEQIAYNVQSQPQGWQSPDIGGQLALAKVQGGRILELANREAQQIFGGAGYQRSGLGARVEQISRDLRMMVVGGGSEEILQDLAFRQETAIAKRNGWKL